ncbi:MAG: filamentous hemagglutinin N-terminal domain-containing protein [Elainella sp. Prado103]|nr:filamentous hemagglutinin N-terminal domain-containing protein [Elainella sp. Prado103]
MVRFRLTQPGLVLGVMLCLLAASEATAQIRLDIRSDIRSNIRPDIRPDNSLSENSALTRQGNTTVIRRGSQRGRNLFHSFERFSIPRNQRVSFQGVAPDTERIFVRVTGDRASLINGFLEVRQQSGSLSQADFFLLNPNGIRFGRQATLNLAGSFIATTAERIQFGDGWQFRAVNPTSTPLLSVQMPIGLQWGATPRAIHNQSVSGLQVDPGNTLALIGGRIQFDGGSVAAPEGRIELAAVGTAGRVNLAPIEQGWRLEAFDQASRKLNLADLTFSQGASINASGSSGGEIQLQGRRIHFNQGSWAATDAFTNGTAGRLQVFATEQVELTGGSRTDPNQRTTLRNEVYQQASGETGQFSLITQRLILRDGAQISTGTYGSGQGVDLTISARERIELSGGTLLYPSGLFARTNRSAVGSGGNLSIRTPHLSLQGGAQISTDTLGAGNAGNVRITASESIEVIGRNPANLNSKRGASGLFAQVRPNASGQGGNLTLRTDRLTVEAGAQISSNTFGSGTAGTIEIVATDSVLIRGTAPIDRDDNISGILVSAEPGASGNARRLTLTTPQLTVAAGARISVDNFGAGERGGIAQLNVSNFVLDRGEINATTVSGQGGIIQLSTDRLTLQDRSQITARAENIADGGNLSINAAAGFVIAAPNQDNNILASADRGRGGNIRIDARGILGLAERRNAPRTSDIDASSEFGVSGTVIINSPEINPTPSPPDLPAAPIRSELAQGCQAEQDPTAAAFFNTGRGGTPPTPYESLSSNHTLADLRLPQPASGSDTTSFVEAQGWLQTDRDQIQLVAEMPAVHVARCPLD